MFNMKKFIVSTYVILIFITCFSTNVSADPKEIYVYDTFTMTYYNLKFNDIFSWNWSIINPNHYLDFWIEDDNGKIYYQDNHAIKGNSSILITNPGTYHINWYNGYGPSSVLVNLGAQVYSPLLGGYAKYYQTLLLAFTIGVIITLVSIIIMIIMKEYKYSRYKLIISFDNRAYNLFICLIFSLFFSLLGFLLFTTSFQVMGTYHGGEYICYGNSLLLIPISLTCYTFTRLVKTNEKDTFRGRLIIATVLLLLPLSYVSYYTCYYVNQSIFDTFKIRVNHGTGWFYPEPVPGIMIPVIFGFITFITIGLLAICIQQKYRSLSNKL